MHADPIRISQLCASASSKRHKRSQHMIEDKKTDQEETAADHCGNDDSDMVTWHTDGECIHALEMMGLPTCFRSDTNTRGKKKQKAEF